MRRAASMLLLALILGSGVAAEVATYEQRTVSDWVGDLYSTDPEVRRAACWVLGRLGPAASTAARPLAARLADPHPSVREEAAWALPCLGAPAVSPLLDALLAPSRPGVCAAVDAFGRLGEPHARTAWPTLLARLEDPRPSVSAAAVRALLAGGPLGRLEAEALAMLLDRDHVLVPSVLGLLGKMGPDAAPAIPALERLASSGGGEPADTALRVLVQIGHEAEPSVQRLIGRFGERGQVMVARQAGASAPVADTFIQQALRSHEPLIWSAVVDGLHGAGVRGLSYLRWAYEHGERKARRAVVLATPLLPESVPFLRAALADPDVEVRYAAARALGSEWEGGCGPQAASALVEGLLDTDPGARELALQMLLRPPGRAVLVVDRLCSLLQEPRQEVGIAARHLLENLGPEATDAVPRLVRLLSSTDPSLQRTAAKALGRIGPAASAAVPDLLLLLRSEDGRVRLEAVEALGGIGASDEATVTAMIAALDDPDDNVEGWALDALVRLGRQDRRAADAAVSKPQLLEAYALSFWSPEIGELGEAARPLVPRLILRIGEAERCDLDVIQALRRMGPVAADALPALLHLVQSPFCRHPQEALAACLAVAEDLEPLWPHVREALKRGAVLRDTTLLDTLGSLGPRARPVVEEIAACSGSLKPWVRTAAIGALIAVAPERPEVIRELTTHVRRGGTPELEHWIRTIAANGAAAKALEPVLACAAGVEDDETQIAALAALARLDSLESTTVSVVLSALRRGSPAVRDAALALMPRLARDDGVLCSLLRALKTRDVAVRRGLAKALGETGPAAHAATSVLDELTRDPVPDVAQAAREALERIRGE